MREFLYCFTMDDVAMDGYSSEAHFERVLDFCRELELKATFFVVPRSGGSSLAEKPGYVRLCHRAVNEGHELAQHGLDHDRFEAGIPPKMILDMAHEAPTREYLASHGDQIAARHTISALRGMLTEGRSIMESALHLRPCGFRGPSGAFCANLLPALAEEGYAYDATIMMQSGAWDLLNGCYAGPAPITRETYLSAQRHPAVPELPGGGEYTWYLDRHRYATAMDLARHDFEACLAAEIPFVSISHVSPLLQNERLEESDIGLQFYRELMGSCRSVLRGRGIAFRSITLAECARQPSLMSDPTRGTGAFA